MGAAGLIPGTPLQLPSDPMATVHSAPAGTVGYYLGDAYVKNASCWVPLLRDQFFRPATLTSLVTDFDFGDCDGDETYNSAYTDGTSHVSIVKNRGSGGNTAQASGGGSFTNPKIAKPGLNGHDALEFDGNYDRLDCSSTDTGWSNIVTKGAFDLSLLVRFDLWVTTLAILGNVTASTENGFYISADLSTANQLQFIAVNGSGTIKFWQPTLTLVPGKWHLIRWHSDGTNWTASLDGGTEQTVGSLGTAGASTMTRNVRLGCTFVTGGSDDRFLVGAMGGRLLYYSAELSTAQWKWNRREYKRVYGI